MARAVNSPRCEWMRLGGQCLRSSEARHTQPRRPVCMCACACVHVHVCMCACAAYVDLCAYVDMCACVHVHVHLALEELCEKLAVQRGKAVFAAARKPTCEQKEPHLHARYTEPSVGRMPHHTSASK